SGTLLLNGANSMVGTVSFNAGTLVVGSTGALSTGTLKFGGGTITAAAPVTVGAAALFSNASTVAGDQPITFNGPMYYTGTTDRTERFSSSALTTIHGGMVITSATSGARTFTLSGTGNVLIDSAISEVSGNPGSLNITNSGVVTLAAVNTYTGTT